MRSHKDKAIPHLRKFNIMIKRNKEKLNNYRNSLVHNCQES